MGLLPVGQKKKKINEKRTSLITLKTGPKRDEPSGPTFNLDLLPTEGRLVIAVASVFWSAQYASKLSKKKKKKKSK